VTPLYFQSKNVKNVPYSLTIHYRKEKIFDRVGTLWDLLIINNKIADAPHHNGSDPERWV